MNDKRKIGSILGAALIFVPYLAMEYMSSTQNGVTLSVSFMEVLFPGEIGQFLASDIKYIMATFLGLAVVAIILNLATSLRILSAIVGIIALATHGLLYIGSAELYTKADFGLAWIIIAVGCIALIVSSFLKKPS